MERRNAEKRTGQVSVQKESGKKQGGQVRAEKTTRAPTKYGDNPYTAVYKVNRSDTLMEFLLRKCNTSRNNVKSMLARRQVLVNGSVVTQFDFPLGKDDEVKLSKKSVQGNIAPAPKKREMERKSKTERGKREQTVVRIIYEDEDFVAIDKPVGLLSVESDNETECAFSHVFAYLQQSGKNVRPYILHRIDKETSGVLVFAKNPKIYSMLKMHWNESVTLREYYAVVEGRMEKKEDTLVSYLKENKNNLMYSTQDITGQKAITKYSLLKENEQYSLLKVQIETGKKNQIRVHMSSLNHPVVGDDKYGGTKNPLKRLGLHASKLAFIHPVKKEEICISASVPASFRALFV
ncbi:MAG: RluA family pseudouridine synthase [Clostridiales bacterium]|nr:RluA family pseudouridine synthase [Clostridiales bacterium]